MRCSFCDSPHAPTALACRVCGGPLRPAQTKLTSVQITIPISNAPRLLKRKTLDEKSPPIAGIGVCSIEAPIVGLVLENGALQRWDAARDETTEFSNRRIFRGPQPVCCAAFSPHDDLLATGHQCGQVRLLSLDGRELQSPKPHLGRALALAWTPTQLYSGGSDGVIWATSVETKRPSQILLEGLGAMTTLAASPDGALLAIGRDDGAVQLWRLQKEAAPRLDWTRTEHAAPVKSLAFSPNGAMLVSHSADGGVCLWAAQTSFQLPLALRARQSGVAPAFSMDNRLLAVAGENGGVAIFSVAMETLLCSLPTLGEIRHLACAPDTEGRELLLVAGGREIALWELGL